MKARLPLLALSLATALLIPSTSVSARESDYVGQVSLVGFGFCPSGTLPAEGQILLIEKFNILYALYGPTFGGDGRTTFALPDLRGRIPIGFGRGPGLTPRSVGEMGGEEINALTVLTMPSHDHQLRIAVVNGPANSKNPIRSSFATAATPTYKMQAPGTDQMHAGTIISDNVGKSAPFPISQPYMAMRFCVATQGLFPPRD